MSVGTPRRSVWFRLYHGETAFDFVGRKMRWFLISGAVILVGIISLADIASGAPSEKAGKAVADISRPGGKHDQTLH